MKVAGGSILLRPTTAVELVQQSVHLRVLRAALSWDPSLRQQRGRILMLHGPPGTGKFSALALAASDTGCTLQAWDVARDLSTAENVHRLSQLLCARRRRRLVVVVWASMLSAPSSSPASAWAHNKTHGASDGASRPGSGDLVGMLRRVNVAVSRHVLAIIANDIRGLPHTLRTTFGDLRQASDPAYDIRRLRLVSVLCKPLTTASCKSLVMLLARRLCGKGTNDALNTAAGITWRTLVANRANGDGRAVTRLFSHILPSERPRRRMTAQDEMSWALATMQKQQALHAKSDFQAHNIFTPTQQLMRCALSAAHIETTLAQFGTGRRATGLHSSQLVRMAHCNRFQDLVFMHRSSSSRLPPPVAAHLHPALHALAGRVWAAPAGLVRKTVSMHHAFTARLTAAAAAMANSVSEACAMQRFRNRGTRTVGLALLLEGPPQTLQWRFGRKALPDIRRVSIRYYNKHAPFHSTARSSREERRATLCDADPAALEELRVVRSGHGATKQHARQDNLRALFGGSMRERLELAECWAARRKHVRRTTGAAAAAEVDWVSALSEAQRHAAQPWERAPVRRRRRSYN